MSAPSTLHEERVVLLGEMADLAGFIIPSRIDAQLTPDIVRLHHRYPRLFVADAKATESPGNQDTKRRILFYLKAIQPWIESKFEVRVAICAGLDPTGNWLETLQSMALARIFRGLLLVGVCRYAKVPVLQGIIGLL